MYEMSVFDPARKKLGVPEHKDVDDAMFQWFQNTRASRKFQAHVIYSRHTGFRLSRLLLANP